MGTYLDILDVNLAITANKKPAALAALQALSPCDYSWANESFRTRATLEDALSDWRWSAETDADDNIIGLEFEGENLGDEETLFETLAPFIEPGGYIDCEAEGQHWRWYFNGVTTEELVGRIVYATPRYPIHPQIEEGRS